MAKYYCTNFSSEGLKTTYLLPLTVSEMLQHKNSLYKHMQKVQEYYH